MIVSKASLLHPTLNNPVALANALNWGFYTTEESIQTLKEIADHKNGFKRKMAALREELPVDPVAEQSREEEIEHFSACLGSIFMIGMPMPKKQVEEVVVEVAAEEAPPVTQEEKRASSFTVVTQTPVTVPAETNQITTAMVTAAQERITELLSQQQQLSLKRRRGLSIKEQQIITEDGIAGQIMSLTQRNTYLELMEKAVAHADYKELNAIQGSIEANYGVYMAGQE